MAVRTRGAAFIAVLSVVLAGVAAQNGSTVPEFRRRECEEFRALLKEHSDVSKFDSKHSTKLGIAGVVLFWAGPAGLPLGISAIVMGERMETWAREKLISMKVSENNYERINELCGLLLNRHKLRDVTFRGRNTSAIVLGGVAMGLGIVAVVVQSVYGWFFCCTRGSKRMFADAESDAAETEGEDDDNGQNV